MLSSSSASRARAARFVPLATGLRDQGTPICSLTFRGRPHELGVPLWQFLSDDRERMVCADRDHIFEHDCLDDFMHLRCQLPGYSAESTPLLFLRSIPIKRYEVGRVVASEMREYMKELYVIMTGRNPQATGHDQDSPCLNGIRWDKLFIHEFYTMDGKEWEMSLSLLVSDAKSEAR